MKKIDIRWVKNRKTIKSSLKLVDRVSYNDYPNGTATVELIGVTRKTPEARVHFIFSPKKGRSFFWDEKSQKDALQDFGWTLNCLVSMNFNEVENDYNYYFNFPNGKHCGMNNEEFDCMIAAMQVIKKDLNNLLTVNNFAK
tara:strand:+ start:469 stop:891 length:423 start_codon:yes stop_codon:yes gene_type:complete